MAVGVFGVDRCEVETRRRREPPPGFLRSRAGFYHPARESLLLERRTEGPSFQEKTLAWLRDNVHRGIPRAYYLAVLGHDLHVSEWAELFVRHYHNDGGWWENKGRVSVGKVTVAFRNFETTNLVTDTTLYGDFKWHEVGLSSTPELNTETALAATTGIARVAGSQSLFTTNVYQTVAIVTADTTEIWQEHGVFNQASLGTMMDRSVVAPTVSVVPGDTVEFTYLLTKNAEP